MIARTKVWIEKNEKNISSKKNRPFKLEKLITTGNKYLIVKNMKKTRQTKQSQYIIEIEL